MILVRGPTRASSRRSEFIVSATQPAVGAKPWARHMDEHGAAAAGNARARVVVDLDDEVVEVVLAREPVGFRSRRHFHRPVVTAVGGVLAPAVLRRNAPGRQSRRRTRMAVGAPPQPLEPEAAARGRAVALALVGFDAGCGRAPPAAPAARLAARREPAAPVFAARPATATMFRVLPAARSKTPRIRAKYQFTLALLALNALLREYSPEAAH